MSEVEFTVEEEAWRAKAACLGYRNWAVTVKGVGAHREYDKRRAVCETCSVTKECLAYALKTMSRDDLVYSGLMYGGKSPTQLRRLRSSR